MLRGLASQAVWSAYSAVCVHARRHMTGRHVRAQHARRHCRTFPDRQRGKVTRQEGEMASGLTRGEKERPNAGDLLVVLGPLLRVVLRASRTRCTSLGRVASRRVGRRVGRRTRPHPLIPRAPCLR
jgi:hypothetical protein